MSRRNAVQTELELKIDCDIHCAAPDTAALAQYLPRHWQEFVGFGGFKFREALDHCYPPILDGNPEETRVEQVKKLFLSRADIAHAILNCYMGLEALQNRDLAVSLASATNQWLADRWLNDEAEGNRLRASIVIATQDPSEAAVEIRKWAMGKVKGGFVQVLLPVHSEVPYGKRQYFPIYDAAAECGVPIGIHFGGLTVTAPTSSGWPSLYIDEYVGMSQIFQSQVLSLIAEGVFERFPDLKVVLVESGFTWLPALMWRLDKEWKGFRREVPWVRELPSTYIRRHFRATVQPVDVPPGDIVQLRRVVDQIGSGNLLMFSSDYPHNHGLDGSLSLLMSVLSDAQRHDVLLNNARDLYRL